MTDLFLIKDNKTNYVLAIFDQENLAEEAVSKLNTKLLKHYLKKYEMSLNTLGFLCYHKREKYRTRIRLLQRKLNFGFEGPPVTDLLSLDFIDVRYTILNGKLNMFDIKSEFEYSFSTEPSE